MLKMICPWITLLLLASPAFSAEAETLKEWKQDDARFIMNTPGDFDPGKATSLIIFLCPNGNSVEQTLGAKLEAGMDWHWDIQHIAAQTRLLRKIDPSRNIVLVVGEADKKSWPAWRKEKGDDNGKIIRKIVAETIAKSPAKDAKVTLAAHSGGGSFIFGYLNGGETIPENIERISWLDANYAYDNEKDHHGDKLLAWLKGDPKRHLVVLAYNDRAATLNGKPFVSETGGTFYRSHKMTEYFNAAGATLKQTQKGDFEEYVGMNGQIHFLLNTNPEKKILHTVLVERNGLLEVLTWDSPLHDKWGGEFWGARAYMDFVEPASAKMRASGETAASRPATTRVTTGASADTASKIPARPANAMGGKLFSESIADLPPKARENAIVAEVLKGNIPDFQRKFRRITVKAGEHEISYDVIPDYLAIGSDEDFVRMPMTPISAKQIADAFGCTLPTRKMVNDIYQQAEVKLEPKPMTDQREAVATYLQHNAIIEQQRAGKPLGSLVAGDKKDVVISNKLKEKPNKVAIYGWHKLDGKPIQPLYTGHGDFYADYSHGIRLIKLTVQVDGIDMVIGEVLRDPALSPLLSDEGPVDAGY